MKCSLSCPSVLLNYNYCVWATQSILSFSIRTVPYEWLRRHESHKVTRCCQASLLTAGIDTVAGAVRLSRHLRCFHPLCLMIVWLSSWHSKQFRWLVSLSNQRPHRMLCGNVTATDSAAIWSGWVHSEWDSSDTRAGSSVISYRMSAVRTYGRASERCQMQ